MWSESISCGKTPVSVLQEFLQKRGGLASYEEVYSQSGTHDNLFQIKVTACGQSAIGTGKSKKDSKQDAAKNLLNLLEVAPKPRQLTSPYEVSIMENTIGQLQEYCVKRLEVPQYELIKDEGPPHIRIFGVRCTVSNMFCDAEAGTKKEAKQLAAKKMLKKLQDHSIGFCEKSKAPSDEVRGSDDICKKGVELGQGKEGTTTDFEKDFKDYFSFFKKKPFSSTEALDSLKLISGDDLAEIKNPSKLMKLIIDEMGASMDVETRETVLHGYVTIAIIKTTPQWTIFGTGDSEEESVNKAFYNALLFLKEMSH